MNIVTCLCHVCVCVIFFVVVVVVASLSLTFFYSAACHHLCMLFSFTKSYSIFKQNNKWNFDIWNWTMGWEKNGEWQQKKNSVSPVNRHITQFDLKSCLDWSPSNDLSGRLHTLIFCKYWFFCFFVCLLAHRLKSTCTIPNPQHSFSL